MKKTLIILLLSAVAFSQSVVVPAGTKDFTIGETFPLMQQVDTLVNEVTLGTPSFELPEQPKPKPVVKKKSFFEKLIESILKLFKKK